MSKSMMATLQQTLDSLVIPAAFARYDRIADTTVLSELYTWKSNVETLLNQLDSFNVSTRTLTISELASLVCVLAPLTATGQWSSPATCSLATACLSKVTASDQLVAHILIQVIKPLFAPTPHPRLHTSTARVLPRPADIQDTYIEQPWKEHPGLDESIRWCLLNTKSSTYESTWPLFLPPIMSILDDYQVPYKLLGVRLVSDMLNRVPPQLLLRTGVDTLMFNSLTHALSHLGDQSTPDLIRLAVRTTLQLIDLTTPSLYPPDGISLQSQSTSDPMFSHALSASQSKSLATRFTRLSFLLSSSLLGTIIMYTPTFLPPMSSSSADSDPFGDLEHVDTDHVRATETPSQELMPRRRSFNPTLVAAAQSLPPVLSALGIGGTRFLKGVIPVLAEWLGLPLPIATKKGCGSNDNGDTSCSVERASHGSELPTVDVTLQVASLSSLSVLFHTCTPRMGGWSTTIVDAIGRCWVGCLDIEHERRGYIASKESLCILKRQLKEIAIHLTRICPSVIKDEYAMLLASNKNLFEGLVEEILRQ